MVAEAAEGEVATGEVLGADASAGLAGVSTRLGAALGGALGIGPAQAPTGISAPNSSVARQRALTRFP
jgi:hypothetical protein